VEERPFMAAKFTLSLNPLPPPVQRSLGLSLFIPISLISADQW
jgi:hypothetical protein